MSYHDWNRIPPGTMIRARFRMGLSEGIWARDISESYPEATLRLLSGVPRGDHALELGEVRGPEPVTVAEAIREHPDISEYDLLFADDQRAVGQYKADERRLYEFLWASALPPEFPIIVEDGEMEFDLTATQEQFEAFGAELDATGQPYELLTVTHTSDRETLVTDRQRAYLTTALREGYFEVPRGCTLAELAETLEVDKSSASETIRRGVGRVISQFVVSRDG